MQIAPFEALYDTKCRITIYWNDAKEKAFGIKDYSLISIYLSLLEQVPYLLS